MLGYPKKLFAEGSVSALAPAAAGFTTPCCWEGLWRYCCWRQILSFQRMPTLAHVTPSSRRCCQWNEIIVSNINPSVTPVKADTPTVTHTLSQGSWMICSIDCCRSTLCVVSCADDYKGELRRSSKIVRHRLKTEKLRFLPGWSLICAYRNSKILKDLKI